MSPSLSATNGDNNYSMPRSGARALRQSRIKGILPLSIGCATLPRLNPFFEGPICHGPDLPKLLTYANRSFPDALPRSSACAIREQALVRVPPNHAVKLCDLYAQFSNARE